MFYYVFIAIVHRLLNRESKIECMGITEAFCIQVDTILLEYLRKRFASKHVIGTDAS